MTLKAGLLDYIITYRSSLTQTDLARELWMIPDRMRGDYISEAGQNVVFSITTQSPLYVGKLFTYLDRFYAVDNFERIDNRHGDNKIYRVNASRTGIVYDPKETQALCSPQDTFLLQPEMIENFIGDAAIETTIGIFIANYLFLVYPFGATVPYFNDEFTASKLEKMIAAPFLDGRISTQAIKDRYINTLSLFGQSNEMICPNISEKTITIPPHIHALRDKLLRDNAVALEAGDASVMSDVEKQLITAYKEYLKGDPSLHFLLKPKYFNVTLKKLFLVQGMTEVFGSPGKFTFIGNPMGQGWKQDNLPDIFNEVRAGSAARALETANGGVIAKLILRVFQDTRIDIEDCGTTHGEKVYGDKNGLKDFIWNYVVESDGSTTLITDETLPSFVGKQLTIRTPGYCQATQGFCAKCFGRLFEELKQKAFAPVANDFARTQTTNSLKSMHGKSHSVADVSDINRYLVKSQKLAS